MKSNLPVGKLSPDLLESLLASNHIDDPTVVIGPKVGEDCAVIDLGDSYLVAKTDPITFATDEIGWYLVCVNGNDIATMGARPRWLLVTLLLPENNTSEALVKNIFSQILTACKKFGITLCGGHTEVTYGLDRPIAVGQMLGQVEKDRLITSSGAQIGDDILLTKGIAVEAISLIAREREETLLSRNYSPQYIVQARQFLKDPGISVLQEAIIASDVGGVHAMHDPTEGGLATGLHEIARCSQVGMLVWPEKIHIFPECRDLCHEFDIDPMGVIASGGLLIVADPSYSSKIIDKLAHDGIHCSIIGRVVEMEEGLFFEEGQKKHAIPIFETDEITKIF
ncbi:AIR synthase family protein [Candidatus Poribacteria bacterium]